MAQQRYASLYERLIANSYKPDDQNENGCWLWTGRRDGKNGGIYGMVTLRIDGKHTAKRVHRVMEGIQQLREQERNAELHEFDPLSLFLELDPDLETIEHLCAHTLCICPDHWIIVDRRTNSALMQSRRKALAKPATMA